LPGGPPDLAPENADRVPLREQLDVPHPSGAAPEEHQVRQQADEYGEDG
jgi:hypothetical protein